MIPVPVSKSTLADSSTPARRALLLGILATLAVFCWQWTTVHANYRGDWTALFCTAELRLMPVAIDQGTYRFTGSNGYDGQMYRLVAHDPWLKKGYDMYVDDTAVRYRRILVPALAWLLALGQDSWIDTAYYAVILLCVFAGTSSLALLLHQYNLPDLWALSFPLLPGCLISIDRMTVDIALFALIAGLLVCWRQDRPRLKWLLLALCPLVRDLGLLVIAAAVFDEIRRRRFNWAAAWATAGIPIAAWQLWLRFMIVSSLDKDVSGVLPLWALRHSGYGIFLVMFDPVSYPLPHWAELFTQTLDFFALAAVVAAVASGILRFPWRHPEFRDSIILLFAALFFLASAKGFWKDIYSYARAFTPLLALLALRAFTGGRRLEALPLAALTIRIIWQMGRQLEGVVRAIAAQI